MTTQWIETDPTLMNLPESSTTSLADTIEGLRQNVEMIKVYRTLNNIDGGELTYDEEKNLDTLRVTTRAIAMALTKQFGPSWFTDAEEKIIRYCLHAFPPSTELL